MNTEPESTPRIAVVGLAGRFPGAPDVEALWRNLRDGVEAIRTFGEDELARAGVTAAERGDPRFVPRGADLAGVELFDPTFFGLSPREAAVTDPQQRLLLELAWEAFEDAARPPADVDGGVGVFVGASRNDYGLRVAADPEGAAALGAFALEVATSRDFLATRIAYLLDLRGPAISVQTACSTSLVAVHLACQSLLAGECDLALAGGVSIRLPQGRGYMHVDGGVASPDGHCRAFDARARGTVAGNGGALVLLRPLEDALRDGDRVHAVILGTAVNNDGRDKVGFTAPSVEGQAAAIEEALAVAEVEPDTIGYVEAHGTGTPLGDPIEVAALAEAFRRRGSGARAGACALGSIKTNLGHLDAAAGVAGLVKAVLAVREGRVPPSLHFEHPNPALALERTPFRVAARLEDWPVEGDPRRAGVSSFGIGGTNAHAVVESPAPVRACSPGRAGPQLVVVSARSAAALARARERLAAHLDAHPALDARAVAWTTQTGRTAFEHRSAAVGSSAAELARALRAADEPNAAPGPRGEAARVAFLFPGQGSQRARMAADAHASEPVFRRELDRAAEVLRAAADLDLHALLENGAQLDETRFAQPALFAVEHALARLWMDRGIEPVAMLGHSLGEYVAACIAGVLSFEDALLLVARRGELMQSMPRGSMLAVAANESILAEYLDGDLALASVNGPELCVASGPDAQIDALAARLEGADLSCKRLRTSHAYHSSMMEGALDPFREALRRVELRPPERAFLSNVTGTWITGEQATDVDYWTEHLRDTVRLADDLAELARGASVALELGPGRTFAPLARSLGLDVLPSLASRPDEDDATVMLTSLGQLWTRGARVAWRALFDETPPRVTLPTYPFERRRCWVGPGLPPEPSQPSSEPARGAPVPRDAAEATPAFAAVAHAWQACLGVDTVAADDDFLELGGSSLLAVQVRAELERALGVDVPLSDVLEATRLGELVARLERRLGGAPLARPRLVCLGSRGTPLHVAHGLDGEVASFAHLARALDPRHALVALRAQGLEDGESPVDDVGELARAWAELVRADGAGPHHLAGYSFGGLVALETARRLQADGVGVASLTLVDARMPLGDERPALDEPALREQARAHLARLGLDPEAPDSARRVEVFAAHARAALRHRPGAWHGDALLVLARDEATPAADEVIRGWRSLVRGELRVVSVAGDHLSLLSLPCAANVAEALASWAESATLGSKLDPATRNP